MSNPSVVVSELSKAYELRDKSSRERVNSDLLWALKDVSLEIEDGVSVGIIGPNGSGKSTLLKLLAGITKPTQGRIEINGKVASILEIGAGFQPELTGRENVFLYGQILGISKKDIKKSFDAIVAFSEIKDFIDEPVKNYSNGMYLRLAFSIITHLEFDVYLFDEVLRVGDARFRAKSNQKIQELQNEGKTIIHVSHSLSELNDKDLYIVMEKGRVLDIGRSKQMLIDYHEAGFLEGDGDVVLTPTTLNEDNFSFSGKIKLMSLSIHQGDGQSIEYLRTDKPLFLELEYESFLDSMTVDVLVLFKDVTDNAVFRTAGFLGEKTIKTPRKGTYKCICSVPPRTFSSQIYRISLLFLGNVYQVFQEAVGHDLGAGKSENEPSEVKTILRYEDVIAFKSEYRIYGKPFSLEQFQMDGSMFIDGDWSVSEN